MFHLGVFAFTIGDYTKQVEYHRDVRHRLTSEAAYLQHGLSSFPGAWVRSHLAFGLAELGMFDEIDELAREALAIAEEVENALTLATTHTFIGMALLRFGKVETALKHLEKGYKVCLDSKIKFMHSYSAGALGCGYLLNKEPNRALALLKQGTSTDYLDHGVWTVHSLTILGAAYRCIGQHRLATDTLSRALKLAGESEEWGFESWAMASMARIQFDAQNLQAARHWYLKALEQASIHFMRPLVAHCYQGLGDTYRCLGQNDEAQSAFEKATDMYRSMNMVFHSAV
jgi:tetratricopeptide (TPR) repeat protein